MEIDQDLLPVWEKMTTEEQQKYYTDKMMELVDGAMEGCWTTVVKGYDLPAFKQEMLNKYNYPQTDKSGNAGC